MHSLLFFILQVLNITGWQLFLSASAIIISIIMGAWRIDRSRKKDFENEISKKADMILVTSELETRDEKINTIRVRFDEHEKHNDDQYQNLKDNLEETNSTIDHIHNRVDKIYEILTKK